MNTPAQAGDGFTRTRMDVLVLENHIVEKGTPQAGVMM